MSMESPHIKKSTQLCPFIIRKIARAFIRMAKLDAIEAHMLRKTAVRCVNEHILNARCFFEHLVAIRRAKNNFDEIIVNLLQLHEQGLKKMQPSDTFRL